MRFPIDTRSKSDRLRQSGAEAQPACPSNEKCHNPLSAQANCWKNIGQVLDPELDESILERGFVESLQVHQGSVTVELRLPTFWCAATFAYLMAADIRKTLLAVRGVRAVTVRLKDHFESQVIEAAVNTGKRFTEAFPGEATDDLDDLRLVFLRKGFLKRQEQFLRSLTNAGFSLAENLRLEHLSIEGTFCSDTVAVEAARAARVTWSWA